MRLGLLINKTSPYTGTGAEYSNAGGDWIGAIATAVSGIVQGGFAYGANKEDNETNIALQELANRQQNHQNALAGINDSTLDKLMTMMLANNANNKPAPTESVWAKNLLPIALIAASAALVIFFVLKSEKGK